MKKDDFTPDLTCDLNGLALKNPVLTASGTFEVGKIFNEFYDVDLLGGIITKTVTLEKRDGNPPPRICEVRSGIINSIGLQNPGVKEFVRENKEWIESRETCVIISVSGQTEEEFAAVCRYLKDNLGFHAVELNVSCPNVKKGGIAFGVDPEAVRRIVKKVKEETGLFVITKLSPWTHLVKEIAAAAEEAGSDALSATNTIPAMAVDLKTFESRIGNLTGGLSGPCIKPVSQKIVYDIARSVDIPVIGLGGIETAEDALEYLVLGASAVEVGSSNMYEPLSAKKVLDGIREYMRKNDIKSLRGIKGKFKGIKDGCA
jgi:dihydroorotate dehydrogenase (NAD+) catalytic subunit